MMSLNAGPESKVLNPTEQWPEGIGKACIPLISWTLARLWPLRSFLSLSPCFSASLGTKALRLEHLLQLKLLSVYWALNVPTVSALFWKVIVMRQSIKEFL